MRSYYDNNVKSFLGQSWDEIWASLTKPEFGDLLVDQKNAWFEQIEILKAQLKCLAAHSDAHIFFEYSIPRIGKRIDVVVLVSGVIFVLEFKSGAKKYHSTDVDQVWDYALDLKYFHKDSHNRTIVPVLICTGAVEMGINLSHHNDDVYDPIKSNGNNLHDIISNVLDLDSRHLISPQEWASSPYYPTPSIIEAAQALYAEHTVKDIAQSEAGNLKNTSDYILDIIEEVKLKQEKAICFVTGVPGAGKTLVGLNISTQSMNCSEDRAVYLSGNGPLVKILVEALTRDELNRERSKGNKVKKSDIERKVRAFIQNVHHFRDEGLESLKQQNSNGPNSLNSGPSDHIVIFDEAQRAWNLDKTVDFMKRKKGLPDFSDSEPEFLISYMDRLNDWAMIVCLVGEGQEIHTGEGGISEWLTAIQDRFVDWKVYLSPHLKDETYQAQIAIQKIAENRLTYSNQLHLDISLRSFRAENLSRFVKCLLDSDLASAQEISLGLTRYPILLTRSLDEAKQWIKNHARGNERYGVIASSGGRRLKPLGIDVKSEVDPVYWFLGEKDDCRSSYYMEDVVTEFDVQGLEIDFACLVWDADFRRVNNRWEEYSFKGKSWTRKKQDEAQLYLKNAYRVLLTRARQGLVIVVPEGNSDDPTRLPEFYDGTYEYLREALSNHPIQTLLK